MGSGPEGNRRHEQKKTRTHRPNPPHDRAARAHRTNEAHSGVWEEAGYTAADVNGARIYEYTLAPLPADCYYFFFATFFFAAFFLAFFFAAIIVSFKVNLGMLTVRVLVRTPIARFFERCALRLFHRSPENISEKPCVVRQFDARGEKKSNTFVKCI